MSDEGRVEYEPRSVKELLGEMKDTAELLIDLSYSSVLFEDADLAEEVLELEARMDRLQLQAWMSLVMAGRSPGDAESLAPVFGVVGAAEKISDAAGDIAKVVREEVGLLPAFRASLPEAVETLARATVAPGSAYADRTLGGINLETETGVRVVAVRRSDAWIHSPDRETTLRVGDVLVCRGPQAGVAGVYETLTGDPFEGATAEGDPDESPRDTGPGGPPPDARPGLSAGSDRGSRTDASDAAMADLDRAVESLVLLKNVSELAVDLAYSSVLFDDAGLAEEVRELEIEVDALKSRFEAWTLRAAASVEDPVALRGLLHVAASTEVISDAAVEISEGVLRGLGTHPVVRAAVEESDEVPVRAVVTPDGDLAGQAVGDLTRSVAGLRVLAVRRDVDGGTADGDTRPRGGGGDTDAGGGTEWRLSPDADTVLRAGDHLIAKGTRAGADRLAALA